MRPNLSNCPQAVDNFLALAALAQEEDGDVEGILVRDGVFSGEDFSHVSVHDAVFDRCRFNGCTLAKTSFVDAEFRGCDFSNSAAPDSFWSRCAWTDCKTVGMDFRGSFLQQVGFSSCQMKYVSFDHNKLKGLLFDGCGLDGAFFTDCKLLPAAFRDCGLTGASFFQTSLKGVDLTSCQIGGLVVSEPATELRGLIVDLYQAAAIAKRLGIVVKE